MKYGFRLSPFYRRRQGRQRPDHAQFQCAVRSRIKRAPAICRSAWSTVRRQHARFFSWHSSELPLADSASWAENKVKASPSGGHPRDAIPHSQDNVRRNLRWQSSRIQMSRPQLLGRGRTILAQPRGESIGLRPGGTEVPLPAEADSRGGA